LPSATPHSLREGLALALTTFTIAPVRAAEVNRCTAAVAMKLASLVGALLGVLIGGLALLMRLAHPPSLLIGVVSVAAAAALTRGLHLDGLADTADALGSYRDRERALAIMKSPEVGPFGVVAIGLALLAPTIALAALTEGRWWSLLFGFAAAFGAGRLAVTWACRHGIPPARTDGLGALVAGTVDTPALVASTLFVAVVAFAADWDHPWHGPIAVLAGLAASALLVGHCVRRFGGVTGDVLGAAVEVATTVTLVGLAL
jgi:adenosylcobinamide-GDP ribazoletransferase